MEPIRSDTIRKAFRKVAEHQLHQRMLMMSGNEAHRILPEIWPVIQELCLLADACEASLIEVKDQ